MDERGDDISAEGIGLLEENEELSSVWDSNDKAVDNNDDDDDVDDDVVDVTVVVVVDDDDVIDDVVVDVIVDVDDIERLD